MINSFDKAELSQWCKAVLPGLEEDGLSQSLAQMLRANAENSNKQIVWATAKALAEAIIDLPPSRRSVVEGLTGSASAVDVDSILNSRKASLQKLLKSGAVRSKNQLRLLEEALADDRLDAQDGSRAEEMILAFLLKLDQGDAAKRDG